MKKLFITIAFVAAAMFAQAQFFVGGNLGMSTTSRTYKLEGGGLSISQDLPKSFTFTIAPSVGFMFNDNMGVGLDLGFGFGKTTRKNYDDETGELIDTRTTKETIISFAPYFRYVFAEIDNFKFYCDAKLAYSMIKPKVTIEGGNTTVTVDGNKTTQFGIGVVPGMAYMLTDNISMNCALNILELGFNTTTEKAEGDGVTETYKTNEFGFGVNNNTPITIGFFYTF